MKREVAIIPFDTSLFSIRYRQRGRLMWGDWKHVFDVERRQCWTYTDAQRLADQALANGVVPGSYESEVHPIIVLEADDVTW